MLSRLETPSTASPAAREGIRELLLYPLAIAVVFFCAIAPTLPWLQFAAGMENVCAGTSLETARDGHWLIPTLHAEPRLKKPPFAHWLGAIGILSSNSMAWGVRWPTLVCACVMLVAVYHIGRMIGGARAGVCAAALLGSSAILLLMVREASYDVPLAMWVALGNLAACWGMLRGGGIRAFLLVGAAAGMGLLTKGPVAVLQTLGPVLVFDIGMAIRQRTGGAGGVVPNGGQGRAQNPAHAQPSRIALRHSLALLIAMTVGLPWFLYVAHISGGAWHVWSGQVIQRAEATFEGYSPWYNYLQFFHFLLPWTLWFIVALVAMCIDRVVAASRAHWLMLCWICVPLLVMCFFPAKRSRYLLPMAAPACIMAALAIINHLPGWLAGKRVDRVLAAIHWTTIIALPTALLIGGSGAWLSRVVGDFARLHRVDGTPWFSPSFATIAAAGFAIILMVSISARRFRLSALVGGPTMVMLLLQALAVQGYRNSANAQPDGLPLAQQILAAYPDAIVYNAHSGERDPPHALSIYLNQPVPRAGLPQVLPASARPVVIVLPGGEVPPTVKGFRWFTSVANDRKWWHAYVREGGR
jgi:4-amino-4-deoxy-L-arabinose transferase-like glycosyltransferase